MHRKLIAVIICSFLIAGFAYSNVILSELRGKVEIRKVGADWTPAEAGMTVERTDTISTGFNSTAVLTMGANHVIVSPLTRMTIDAFLERETTVDTKLYLQVGAVRAQVDNSGAKRQSFTITSPYSTASVRGTEFVFDGLMLKVLRGSVALLVAPPRRESASAGDGGESGDDDGEGEGDGEGDGADGGSGEGAGAGEGEPGDTGGIIVAAGQIVTIDVDFATGSASSSLVDRDGDYRTDASSSGGSGGGSTGGTAGGSGGGGSVIQTRGSAVIDWEWED